MDVLQSNTVVSRATCPGAPASRPTPVACPPAAGRSPTSCSASAASSAGDPNAWRALAAAAAADGYPDGNPRSPGLPLEYSADWRALESAVNATATLDEETAAAPPSWPTAAARAWAVVRHFARSPAGRAAAQALSVGSSLLFVALYVWSTYSPPPPGSARAAADAGLCVVFAADYIIRLARTQPGNRLRSALAFGNILDFLAVFPPLLELLLRSFAGPALSGPAVTAGRGAARAAAAAGARSARALDLRWFKALRALRVLRVSVLAGELGSMHAASSGALLASAASVRLFQLVASVATLLFTAAAVVNLVEKMPFHDALYFVTTTLATVGYGDVVVRSAAGKAAVILMILVGIVVIPVQSGQLYQQLAARRVTLGPLPDRRSPAVLVSSRLSDVRGFSDFLAEFYATAARKSAPLGSKGGSGGGAGAGGGGSSLPRGTRLVVLTGKPDFEFRALQELNDGRLTLVEGTALSERDLQRTRAEAALGVLLLADRFAPSAAAEDLSVLFQVWAVKSYTKRVPLYVQTLSTASLAAVRPFLDGDRDVAVSVEQTRHRLLALSALCPGASTLIANLLRRSDVDAAAATRARTAGGRRWLRAYITGCAHKVHAARLGADLACVPFADAAAWLHGSSGMLLIGVERRGRVVLNPGRRLLRGGDLGVVVAPSAAAAAAALARPYSPPGVTPAVRGGGGAAGAAAASPSSPPPAPPPPPSPPLPANCPPLDAPVDSESVDFEGGPGECDVTGALLAVGEAGAGATAAALPPASWSPTPLSSMATAGSVDDGNDSDGFEEEGGEEEEEEEEDAEDGRPPPPLPPQPSSPLPRNTPPTQAPPPSPSPSPACPVSPVGFVDDEAYYAAEAVSHDDGVPAAGAVALVSGGTAGGASLYASSSSASSPSPSTAVGPLIDGALLAGHVIIAGSPASYTAFAAQLRACDPLPTPIVILAPANPPPDEWAALRALGPVHFVAGDPADPAGLRAARASSARALVFLALPQRPGGGWAATGGGAPPGFPGGGDPAGPPAPPAAAGPARLFNGGVSGAGGPAPPPPAADRATVSRTAVLADAHGLLACYGVGEDGGTAPPHAVIELCFTSSLRFLQPGLLLKGVSSGDPGTSSHGQPRKSWQARKRQEAAAAAEGLAAWQANPYYCAGRVTVPAALDALACHAIFDGGRLAGLLAELAGDDGRPGGALLRQVDVPPDLVGATYGALFARLATRRQLIPLGLYRRKSENPTWRLAYVVTNPPAGERLEKGDRVFVLRERGGPWLTSGL